MRNQLQNKFEYDADFFIQIPRTPEQRLIIAVLIRCVKDIFDEDKYIKKRALQFMLARTPASKAWSFRWLCSELNLNPRILIKNIIDNKENLLGTGLRPLVYNR